MAPGDDWYEWQKSKYRTAKKAESETDNRTYVQIFKENILFNKTIWMLAVAYIFVYIINVDIEKI